MRALVQSGPGCSQNRRMRNRMYDDQIGSKHESRRQTPMSVFVSCSILRVAVSVMYFDAIPVFWITVLVFLFFSLFVEGE